MFKLELRELTKRYGTQAVVDGVTLSLAEGELLTLLGPSGCGKTTTLRMIAGFVKPSAGSIVLDGVPISSERAVVAPERRGMSMIFQSYAIWPNMTVAENVAFGLNVRHCKSAEMRTRVAEMLDVVKLGHLADRYPAELSGGQQQRVALARAIVIKPAVLLLDEPLSNLDASLREEMAAEIRRLHDQFRFTTVYVTHDQNEAMSISDRVVVMNGGRIEQLGSPWELYNHPASEFVANFVGRTNLLSGKTTASTIDLDEVGLSLPLRPDSTEARGNVMISVRPHAFRLASDDPCLLQLGAVVVEKASYFGQHWDYSVRAGRGAQAVTVSTPPSTRLRIGEQTRLAVEPDGYAVIPSAS